jgi:repressor LexA
MTQPVGIPIRGTIAAGLPLDIFSETNEFLPVTHAEVEESTFALRVKGQSMIDDHICDGDIVVIKPQDTCHNGDIIVATHALDGVNGSATLKRFFQERGRVRLQPANAEMQPLFIAKNEWDREWKIQGTVKAIVRQFPVIF